MAFMAESEHWYMKYENIFARHEELRRRHADLEASYNALITENAVLRSATSTSSDDSDDGVPPPPYSRFPLANVRPVPLSERDVVLPALQPRQQRQQQQQQEEEEQQQRRRVGISLRETPGGPPPEEAPEPAEERRHSYTQASALHDFETADDSSYRRRSRGTVGRRALRRTGGLLRRLSLVV